MIGKLFLSNRMQILRLAREIENHVKTNESQKNYILFLEKAYPEMVLQISR